MPNRFPVPCRPRRLIAHAGGHSGDVSAEHRPDVVYRESLRTPWWWYPVGMGIAALLAAEFHIAGLSIIDRIAFGVLIPLSIGIVWSLGRSALAISGGEIRLRGAHLPLDVITGAVALDAQTLRRVIGREGDPAAFVSIRSWIGPGVQLWLDDPDDPAPYWLLSSRHPQHVVDLIRAQNHEPENNEVTSKPDTEQPVDSHDDFHDPEEAAPKTESPSKRAALERRSPHRGR